MDTERTENASFRDTPSGASARLRREKDLWRMSSTVGFIFVPLGIFSIFAPTFSGIAVTLLVGCLLIMSGVIQTYFAVKNRNWHLLTGLFGVVSGIVMVMVPDIGLQVLTILLACFFAISAVSEVVLAFKLRPGRGWTWMIFDGIVSLTFALIIVLQWPLSGLWAVGVLVGVRLIMLGWALTAIGSSGEQVIGRIEEYRTDEMENHIHALTIALQETQLLAAAQSAAIISLATEVQQKVSSSQVDPLIKDLNRKAGEAREMMTIAAEATRENWHQKQVEATAAFSKLQKITQDLAAVWESQRSSE